VNFNDYIHLILDSDALPGGVADGYTPELIAKKHGVPVEDILYQLAMGIKIEYEHTTDKDIARNVAMDHLIEIPDYYTRLHKMEQSAKKLKNEMVSSGVVGDSGYEDTGIAPQDNIPYAKGDSRIPKPLFTKEYKSKNKKKNKKNTKKRIQVQRRPIIGM